MDRSRHDEIALLAYALWEREGRPQGRSLDHWVTAERQLITSPPSPAAGGGALKKVTAGVKTAAPRAKKAQAKPKGAGLSKKSKKPAGPTTA